MEDNNISQVKEIKKCPHCKTEVDPKASRCPHCHGKIFQWTFIKILVVGFFSLMVLSAVISTVSYQNYTSKEVATIAPLSISEEGYLDSGNPTVILGTTKDNYDEALKLSIAKDSEGITKMLLNNQVIMVKSGTKIRVIDTSMFEREVRILDGKEYGQSGWTANEFVKENK